MHLRNSLLLSVSRWNESEASRFDESERAGFDNLSDRQQEAFEMTLRYDCNVVQSAFVFGDDRVTVVKYDGEYYYLRVAVV